MRFLKISRHSYIDSLIAEPSRARRSARRGAPDCSIPNLIEENINLWRIQKSARFFFKVDDLGAIVVAVVVPKPP